MHVSDIDPDFPVERWPGFWEELKSKKTLTFESRHRRKNGDIFPVEITANFLEFEGREHVFAYIKDISNRIKYENERKNLEQQLHQSQKMEAIGTLAGGIAHDFNNILSGIFGYSQLAQSNIKNPEKAYKNIDQIIKGAKRAAELVRQILTFSRQTEYQKKPYRVYLEVNEALNLLRSTIPTNIEIVREINSRAMVFGDPGQIHQILMNLCTNAYHAMKKAGGCLTVSLTEVQILEPKFLNDKKILPGNYLILKVRDTGCGMDEKILKKVFDPYYTTKGPGEGTGLGLAIVQAVVDEHDGYLDVLSIPGKGTQFYIYFPVVKEKYKNPRYSKSLMPSSFEGNEKILFVDDEDTIRQSHKDLLEKSGYQVLTVDNSIDAFKIFKTDPGKFDLIITDMTMPGWTGDKFATQVLKIKPDMPIILCTGFSENMSKAKAAEVGIKKFIQKPVEIQELLVSIRDILDKNDETILS